MAFPNFVCLFHLQPLTPEMLLFSIRHSPDSISTSFDSFLTVQCLSCSSRRPEDPPVLVHNQYRQFFDHTKVLLWGLEACRNGKHSLVGYNCCQQELGTQKRGGAEADQLLLTSGPSCAVNVVAAGTCTSWPDLTAAEDMAASVTVEWVSACFERWWIQVASFEAIPGTELPDQNEDDQKRARSRYDSAELRLWFES